MQKFRSAPRWLNTILRRIGLALAACSALSAATRGAEKHTQESLSAVKQSVADGKAVLIDVREKDEWEEGHLRDAKSLPLSRLQNDPDHESISQVLPRDKVIYLHCAAGKRCLKAAELLKALGFESRALKPGYDALIDAGFAPADKPR